VNHLTASRTLTKGFGDGFAYAFEFAATTGIFLGLGWLLDRWLGTDRVFMIVFAVLGIIGQSLRLWYAYDAKMRALEAERRKAPTP
jgi:F0F1-type ATP synthase assembly protein I